MTYLRTMSETLKDSHGQPMLVWDQGGAANAANASFHMIGRIYSHGSLTDLSAALTDILQQIKDYRSDLAAGLIDIHGVKHQIPIDKTSSIFRPPGT